MQRVGIIGHNGARRRYGIASVATADSSGDRLVIPTAPTVRGWPIAAQTEAAACGYAIL